MRLRVLAVVALVVTGAVALSLTRGQDPRNAPAEARPAAEPPVVPADYREPAPRTVPVAAVAPATPALDVSKLTDPQRQVLLTAQRGALWLWKMNAETGRFVYGFLPALDRRLEGDNFLHQAAAAGTLARAARATGDERFAARAAQALLILLEETTADPKDPQVRYTTLPSIALNRLAAAGVLVAAIHELPNPQADLLEKSDQLCNFIRRQARSNGSLCTSDPGDDGQPLAESPDAVNTCPGPALYGLMLSQRHRPAAWKIDLVRKAVAYYHPWWKANKNPAFVPAQTAAYTEAYLLTKEKEPAFAACVLEMNDWLCGLQYDAPPVKWWYGGFRTWKDGRAVEAAPTVAGAACAESLGRACRVARQTADDKRYDRYTAAVERHLVFLTELQYTTANTRHYDVAYREFLIGGFHPSQQDGDLRIDYTQQAVAAMLQYVER